MGVDALRRSRTALLTSYRRNGQQVATPVSISLAGGRAYFVTAVDSGKARRLAHDPRVLLAPCTVGGERLGADVPGRARRLERGARRARPMPAAAHRSAVLELAAVPAARQDHGAP
jgi:PPOX class probable F420-dependent enzyme